LTARMLVLGRVARDRTDADRQVRSAIASGAGLERFRQIVEIQGGDPRIVDDYQRLPHAPQVHVVTAGQKGYLERLDAELVGRASVLLGAGRDRVEDPVDPAVGIMVKAKPGDHLSANDPVLEVHYRDAARRDAALVLLKRAVDVGDRRPELRPVLVGEVL